MSHFLFKLGLKFKPEAQPEKPPRVEIPPPESGFMRVAIERRAQPYEVPGKGMFSASTNSVYHQVLLSITFSQEALAIINKYDLWSMPLDEITDSLAAELGAAYREASASTRAIIDAPTILKLKDFLDRQPFVRSFDTPGEADHYEQKLKKEILPKIKQAIESVSTTRESKAETFEL